MTITKSVMSGLVTLILANAGAHAADLPGKAKPVEYVRVCSLYGAGFFYVPGTDTCIKLGGFLRAEVTSNGGFTGQPAWNGDPGQGNRYFYAFAERSRLRLAVDTRTATEYGSLRTYAESNFDFSSFNHTNNNPNSIATATNPVLNEPGGGYVSVEMIFLQFAGFTIGKSASGYASPWQGFPGNNTLFLLGGHYSGNGIPNIQYTAEFGNGLTGTIGLDDPVVYYRTSVYNLSTGLNAVGTGATSYAGARSPDIVGRIRVDQAWGLFQVSAAGHEVNGSYNVLNTVGAPAGAVGLAGASPTNLSEISGHPETKWGGSAMAALKIKNIPTGPGDDFNIDASYAKGHTKNVISTGGSSPTFAMFGGSNSAYQSVGFGATTDAVFLPLGAGGTGDLKLTTAYGVRGAFNHNWDPYWSSSVWGSASFVRYDGSATDITSAKGQYCATYIASNKLTAAKTSADFSCDPNYNVYQLGTVVRWTPVKDLAFSAEIGWFGLKQSFTGAAVLTPAAPKPNATYEYKNQDTVSLSIRIQRNF
jgi:hypothetical protein